MPYKNVKNINIIIIFLIILLETYDGPNFT